jgi:hypothetical protein
LDISPLFFHIVSKLVQALVITYDEIFKALATEDNDQPPKSILDLGFDSVIRWKLPASEMFFQFAEHMEVQEGGGQALWWVGWVPEMASGAGHLPLLPGRGKSDCML